MWETIKEDVMDDLKKMKEITGFETLHITGISMGGALAVLAYIDIAHFSLFDNIRVTTFGAPRVGNKHWAAYFDLITLAKTRRYYLNGDPIIIMPRCLTLLCTYRQTGIAIGCYDNKKLCIQEVAI